MTKLLSSVTPQDLVPVTTSGHKRLSVTTGAGDKELYQRQIDTTDKEIDKLVYELYGLTEEEIKIVEATSNEHIRRTDYKRYS